MNLLLINILLALAWAGFTGRFNPGNLVIGFLLGYLVLSISRRAFSDTSYFTKLPQVIGFFLFFIWELLLASLRVARRIFTPLEKLHPRVVAIPLEKCTEIEITIMSTLISLTPGTLSVDASPERNVLYVHAIDAPDPEELRRSIQETFERPLLRLMRGSSYEAEKKPVIPRKDVT